MIEIVSQGVKIFATGNCIFYGGWGIFFESVEFFEVVKIVSKMLR